MIERDGNREARRILVEICDQNLISFVGDPTRSENIKLSSDFATDAPSSGQLWYYVLIWTGAAGILNLKFLFGETGCISPFSFRREKTRCFTLFFGGRSFLRRSEIENITFFY